MDMFSVQIHRDGWPFIGIFAFISILLWHFAEPLGWVGAILTGWCVYFFRDPDRVVPTRKNLVVSPADGVVQMIKKASLPDELDKDGKDWVRISIFLNVFNVHVNRVPIAGKILKSIYHPGKFLNAAHDKASEHNERQTLFMSVNKETNLCFVQIAGLIARRIRCDIQEGQSVKTGQRFGLIRFGSRMDVYMPAQYAPMVIEGQKVIAGETILADLDSEEAKRVGEVR